MNFYRNNGERITSPIFDIDWSWNAWEPHEPIWHEGAGRSHEHDQMEHHVDLGCGKLKKGRIGVDRHYAPGVNVVMNLDDSKVQLPFSDNSIRSVISHHFFEHVSDGFIALVDEVYRVLEPNGVFRVITPCFPSTSAVQDPDHKRYFMAESDDHCTWDTFCAAGDGTHWHESFSVPYTQSRFKKVDQRATPRLPNPQDWWGPKDHRELRCSLVKVPLVGGTATPTSN